MQFLFGSLRMWKILMLLLKINGSFNEPLKNAVHYILKKAHTIHLHYLEINWITF